MARVAFVLGFGFGRANQSIAGFVAQRHRVNAFQHIFAQEAVLDGLHRALHGVPVRRMHAHGKIYVNTLDAIGLGLMQLYEIDTNHAPCAVEILAHALQFERAIDTGARAVIWLKRANSSTDQFIQYMESLTLLRAESPNPMPLNRWRESWRQPWTCHSFLYRVVEALAARRDFCTRGNWYEKNPDAFYDHLLELERRIGKADGLVRILHPV